MEWSGVEWKDELEDIKSKGTRGGRIILGSTI